MKNNVIWGLLVATMLTARMGVFNNAATGMTETWYNLPMRKVVERATCNGIIDEYWERADGCKMYGKYIIVATRAFPYGTVIETSRGKGIVLDVPSTEKPNVVDMAVTW